MPNIDYAIQGQDSLERKRHRLAEEADNQIAELPNWMKNWTKERGEEYLDTLDFSSPAVIKNVFKKLWSMCVILRDKNQLYHDED